MRFYKYGCKSHQTQLHSIQNMADIVAVFAVKAGLNDTEPLLSMVQAMCGSDSMLTLTEEQIVVTSTSSQWSNTTEISWSAAGHWIIILVSS